MSAIPGKIILGLWVLGDTVEGAVSHTGSFTCNSRTSFESTGIGGISADTFNSILGYISLGGFEPGQIAIVTGNLNTGTGAFTINSRVSVSFLGVIGGGRFECDSATHVSFYGTLGISYDVYSHTDIQFTGVGSLTGGFSIAGITSVQFDSGVTTSPRFEVGGVTDIIFYVRSGQSAQCWYDNGYIPPPSSEKNYVF